MEAREYSFVFCHVVHQSNTIETIISSFFPFLDSFNLSNRTKKFAGTQEVNKEHIFQDSIFYQELTLGNKRIKLFLARQFHLPLIDEKIET
jgi:hypothetical protein